MDLIQNVVLCTALALLQNIINSFLQIPIFFKSLQSKLSEQDYMNTQMRLPEHQAHHFLNRQCVNLIASFGKRCVFESATTTSWVTTYT